MTDAAERSNLPACIDAATIAQLYRKRWRIEGLSGRLESVLQSEIRSLGHPRAVLLGFAVAVLALLKHCVEQAHSERAPDLDVSTYHLGVHVASDYLSGHADCAALRGVAAVVRSASGGCCAVPAAPGGQRQPG